LTKPGAGKTTFLKYLATQCIWSEFQANRVPIFITLKDFAESSNQPALLKFINHLFFSFGVTEPQVFDLLKHGRFLFLLDGLDEVREEDISKVVNQIKKISEQFFLSEKFKVDREKYSQDILEYHKSNHYQFNQTHAEELRWLEDNFPDNCYTNYFVITCRIAAREEKFEKFTEVEVADFDNEQIKTFVNKWFSGKKSNAGRLFIQQLESNTPIKELATNPLLLTLLCSHLAPRKVY
jgi:predicted NACHT family NTPase